jgi:hypothetical protein
MQETTINTQEYIDRSDEDRADAIKQVDNRIKKLNPEVKEYIKSQKFKDVFGSLVSKYNLTEEEANEIEETLMFNFLCFTKTEELDIYLEDILVNRNSVVRSSILDEIKTKIIPENIQNILDSNWREEEEVQEMISDSVEFYKIPIPPGFNSHYDLLLSYLNPENIKIEQSSNIPFTPEKVNQLENIGDIKPMQVKNQEIRKYMDKKPSETTVSWEDRLSMSNSANPNVTRRTNTDQTLPSLGGNKDQYREIPE